MWTLNPSEKLRFWFSFRKNLDNLDFDTALKETIHLWSYAPYVQHYLSVDSTENWPDPWQLVYENQYCDVAKALGMLYTLYFCKHRPLIELRIYKDNQSKEQYNLVWIQNGKYVLNYIFNEVVNKKQLDKNLQLIKTITIDNLSIQQL